jgi:hypothetical protein
LYLPLGGRFNKQDKQWSFGSGAIVEFGFLDAPEDRYNFQGRAFSFLGFDELGLWPADGVDASGEPVNTSYVFLLSRLRTTKDSGLRLEVRATGTAGGPGHGWIQARFGIPGDGSSSERVDPATGYRRVFISARIDDNPYLAGTEYARFLDTLPEADRRAFKEGRWDSFVGSVFTDFDPAIHVIEPFPVPAEFDLWRGCDDGFAAPAAVLWLAKEPTTERVYVVSELYRVGMTPFEMAEQVLRIDREIPMSVDGVTIRNDCPVHGIIDSASFSDEGLGGRAGLMNQRGCMWSPCEKGVGSRVGGKSMIHDLLKIGKDGKPGLQVFKHCRNLIRTLPLLCYDKTHPEDVDASGESHLYDALRYGLQWRRPVFRKLKVRGL